LIGICEGAVLVKRSVPVGDSDLLFSVRSSGVTFLVAPARQRGVGVNVERPEPEARTNDVDAGDERRRLELRDVGP
jgi:hypothetical protein